MRGAKQMDKKLKVAAAFAVTKSKMTNEAKLQLLKFIRKEATEAQIKALLLDGAIVTLDEQAEEIVNSRFSASKEISRFLKLASIRYDDIKIKLECRNNG